MNEHRAPGAGMRPLHALARPARLRHTTGAAP